MGKNTKLNKGALSVQSAHALGRNARQTRSVDHDNQHAPTFLVPVPFEDTKDSVEAEVEVVKDS